MPQASASLQRIGAVFLEQSFVLLPPSPGDRADCQSPEKETKHVDHCDATGDAVRPRVAAWKRGAFHLRRAARVRVGQLSASQPGRGAIPLRRGSLPWPVLYNDARFRVNDISVAAVCDRVGGSSALAWLSLYSATYR